ncbi:hypothetical protein BDF21DRAFT_463203 [Thamnidium elegans]|nr:hypothetical protein BDF21DRAFT_463203 [Thamnidium elegans]
MESEDSEQPTILRLERNEMTNRFERPFCNKTWLPVQALALVFIDTLGNAAILLVRTNIIIKSFLLTIIVSNTANSSSDEESDIEDTTIATIEMKATELSTVFPESVDSP